MKYFWNIMGNKMKNVLFNSNKILSFANNLKFF